MYLTVSIVDHVGFFTTYDQIGGPTAFEDMSPSGGAVVPSIQTAVDALFLVLVVRSRDIGIVVAASGELASAEAARLLLEGFTDTSGLVATERHRGFGFVPRREDPS